MKEMRYYFSFEDDFVKSKNQNYKIPDDYNYIKGKKAISNIIYALFFVFGVVYLKLILHVRIKGRDKLKKEKSYFLFGNHTQPLGDVFLPALIVCPKRFWAIVSSANLGIPVLGKLLPHIGALPLPSSVKALTNLRETVTKYYREGYPIVIYPEGHVWEYMKDIRPFSDASFDFPVKENAPVYTFTSTYQKSRFFKRPLMTVYIDGPFYPDSSLTNKKQRIKLCEEIYKAMTERSKLSDTEYIKYCKKNLKTY